MKYIKPFNENITDGRKPFQRYSDNHRLINTISRRIQARTQTEIIEKILLEFKKETPNMDFVNGLAWSIGIDRNRFVNITRDGIKLKHKD